MSDVGLDESIDLHASRLSTGGNDHRDGAGLAPGDADAGLTEEADQARGKGCVGANLDAGALPDPGAHESVIGVDQQARRLQSAQRCVLVAGETDRVDAVREHREQATDVGCVGQHDPLSGMQPDLQGRIAAVTDTDPLAQTQTSHDRHPAIAATEGAMFIHRP